MWRRTISVHLCAQHQEKHGRRLCYLTIKASNRGRWIMYTTSLMCRLHLRLKEVIEQQGSRIFVRNNGTVKQKTSVVSIEQPQLFKITLRTDRHTKKKWDHKNTHVILITKHIKASKGIKQTYNDKWNETRKGVMFKERHVRLQINNNKHSNNTFP